MKFTLPPQRAVGVVGIALLLLATSLITDAQASPSSGTSCSQVGRERTSPTGTLRCVRMKSGRLRWRVVVPAAAGATATTSVPPRAPTVTGVSVSDSSVTFSLSDMAPDSGNYAVQWVDKGSSFANYRMIRVTSPNVTLSPYLFGCARTYTVRVFVMHSDWRLDKGHTNENVTPHSEPFDITMQHSCGGGRRGQFAVSFSGDSGDGYGYDIAVDAAGSVYTTGAFEGTVDFDPGAGVVNLTSAGSGDVFISKIDSYGDFVWARRLGSTGDDLARGLATDSSGNVHVVGKFQGTVDFDPGSGVSNLTSAGFTDAFVAKFDPSGGVLWAQRFGGTSIDEAMSVAVDASGNVHVVGSFGDTVSFGSTSLTASNLDVFVLKLNASGVVAWAVGFGGTDPDDGWGIAVDSSGNVYTSGYFRLTVDFDPGGGVISRTTAGFEDAFVLKLTSTGTFVWVASFGGTVGDVAYGLALDSSDNVYVTGFFRGTVDFDPGAGTSNLTGPTGVDAAFVLKLNAAGGFQWASHVSGSTNTYGYDITVDALNNVLLTGNFGGTGDFDPGAGTATLTSDGDYDVYILALSSAGAFRWVRHFVGTGDVDIGDGIAVDTSGNVHTVGYFDGTIDLDPGVGAVNFTAAGVYDVFVSKLTASGNLS